MKLRALAGTIERRVLVNYRVDPDAIREILPGPFEPLIVKGFAIAGICLIELRVRPVGLPAWTGLRSLNGAHRIAVSTPHGMPAVYIPRRDTNSRLNKALGGRVFPGMQHMATITADDNGDRLAIDLASHDRKMRMSVVASVSDCLDEGSVFERTEHVSDFFEQGSLGYSDTPGGTCYDGVEVRTSNWSVTPLTVEHVESTFFEDPNLFPAGAAELDSALLMRDIQHTWHNRPSLTAVDERVLAI